MSQTLILDGTVIVLASLMLAALGIIIWAVENCSTWFLLALAPWIGLVFIFVGLVIGTIR